MNKITKIKNFVEYLKKNNFPKEKYNALNNNLKLNEFKKIYKKKFLNDYNLQEILKTYNKLNILFKKSISYISEFQSLLLEKGNLESYITGGSALKLYSMLDNKINNNNKILETPDFDMYLIIDNNRISNNLIIKNTLEIIDILISIIKNINYNRLELYLSLNYQNTNDFLDIIIFLLNNDFDLLKYNPYSNSDCYCYYFKFIKIISKECCIKLTIKFITFSKDLSKSMLGILLINNYYFNKNKNYKLSYNFLPIEIVIIKKNKENLKLISNNIKINNKILYIFNEKAILYNLLNLVYKYKYLINSKSIKDKLNYGKNKRDNERLNYFFNYYCNIYYPQLNIIKRNNILKKLKNNIIKFNKPVIELKKISL